VPLTKDLEMILTGQRMWRSGLIALVLLIFIRLFIRKIKTRRTAAEALCDADLVEPDDNLTDTRNGE